MLSPARASLYCCGLMPALPFVQPYHRFPLTSFYSEWLAFALGLLAALVLLRRPSGPLATYPAVALAPLGLILLLGLQTALGRVPYPEQALVATLYLLWTSLIIALGHRLGQELGFRSVSKSLAWFVLAGGLLNALAGVIQHYDLTTPIEFLIARKDSAAVFGNLAQPNHFAAQIAMALASVAYLYARRRLGISAAIVCVAILLFVLALAGSRSPWLYVTAFILLALLARRLRPDDESRRLVRFAIWLLPGFLVAQGAAFLMAPTEGLQVTSVQRVFSSASGVAARLELWGDAWRMFLAAPILGSGWGQFSWHHFLNQAATGASAAPQLFNHAHNLALQLLAETGLVVFVTVLGAALVWLGGLRKVAIDSDWWWLLAMMSVIGIHSMLEYPLWYSIFLGPAALLLGLGTQHVLTVRFQGALRLTVLACILAGSLYLLGVLAPYREFERVVFSPDSSSLARADERAFMAVISDVHREPLPTPYVELAIAHGVTVSRDSLPEKLDVTRRAMHFAPVAMVVYRHALLLALAGDNAAALRQLEGAIRVYPGELGEALRQLRALAREHPEEITPLLELATAKSAELRAPAAHR